MSSLQRGLLVAAVHVAIVLTVAGKYGIDRGSLPRAWARVTPFDPNLPIRGRYVRLAIHATAATAPKENLGYSPVKLTVEKGQLVATPYQQSGLNARFDVASSTAVLYDAIAFFIPEHVPDPSHRPSGEELWAELSIPKKGPPRPVRLGVKKNGVLTPLDLH